MVEIYYKAKPLNHFLDPTHTLAPSTRTGSSSLAGKRDYDAYLSSFSGVRSIQAVLLRVGSQGEQGPCCDEIINSDWSIDERIHMRQGYQWSRKGTLDDR